ncbi:MAG: PQQ-binding-like beta-propeller repeat protein [Kiritimatiellae bacterium]|nr:PQQ-binding-like beta-propeller repeat protein [Kiritimatiellia bacterium]
MKQCLLTRALGTLCSVTIVRCCLALDSGSVQQVSDGLLFVPERVGINAPVIVLVEEQGRAKKTLEMMDWALKEEGIPAIVPIVAKEGDKLAGADAWSRTESLLRRLEVDYGISGRNLYTLGFSSSGAAAYDLALAQPSKFKGIIAAATFAPTLPKTLTPEQKKLKVLLVAPDKDEYFGVETNKKTQNILMAAGLSVTLKTVQGDHFSPLQKHAHVLLRWAAGGRSSPVAVLPTKANAVTLRAQEIPVKWSRRLPALPAGAPISAADFAILPTDDGKAHLLGIQKGEILRSISLGSLITPQKRPAAGKLFGTILIIPLRSETAANEMPDLLIALDLKDERIIWEARPNGGILSSISGKGALFGFGTNDGHYRVWDSVKGAEIWSVSVGGPCAASGRFARNIVYLCGLARIFAFDFATGQKLWETTDSSSSRVDSMAVSDTSELVFVVAGRQAIGLNSQDGSKLWQIPLDGESTTSPCFAQNHFIVATTANLVAISTTGRRLWAKPLTRPVTTPLQSMSGFVLLVTGEGQLVVIRADSGLPVAASREKLNTAYCPVLCGFSCVAISGEGAVVCFDLSSL